jgi:hypothetical protein
MYCSIVGRLYRRIPKAFVQAVVDSTPGQTIYN